MWNIRRQPTNQIYYFNQNFVSTHFPTIFQFSTPHSTPKSTQAGYSTFYGSRPPPPAFYPVWSLQYLKNLYWNRLAVRAQMNGQRLDGWTDRCYQVHYLPGIAVDKNEKHAIILKAKTHKPSAGWHGHDKRDDDEIFVLQNYFLPSCFVEMLVISA